MTSVSTQTRHARFVFNGLDNGPTANSGPAKNDLPPGMHRERLEKFAELKALNVTGGKEAGHGGPEGMGLHDGTKLDPGGKGEGAGGPEGMGLHDGTELEEPLSTGDDDGSDEHYEPNGGYSAPPKKGDGKSDGAIIRLPDGSTLHEGGGE